MALAESRAGGRSGALHLELISVTLTGYKRFKAKTSLQTNGKLIALLGPNEAGKSSLLNAIAHLGDSRPITIEEQSRDIDPNDLRIVGRFFLNNAELSAAGLSGPRSMIVTKKVNGKRTFGFDPAAPDRDIVHRSALASGLRDLIANPKVAELLQEHDEDLSSDMSALANDIMSRPKPLVPRYSRRWRLVSVA
jgi:ABC-type cobalamin/Fe3+-siderophores transport system ATPase subunit